MSGAYDQWDRKIGLLLYKDQEALDLSELHIQFHVQNADVEHPNTLSARVYNLSKDTVKRIVTDRMYQNVVLNAGYTSGNYGVIFQGTIKQFRVGRKDAINSYVDILAADGDIGYNQGVVAQSVAKGLPMTNNIQTAVGAMPQTGLDLGALKTNKQHTLNIRGNVQFGMARARLREIASTLDAGWSIQNGKVTFIDNTGYREGEILVLNSLNGMVGVPEQTDGGIRIKCLLNPRIRIGNRVQINNDDIFQLLQANPNAAPVPFDQWAGIQPLAPLSGDGTYRAFVVEHEGDNRGNNWYSNLICLAVDETAPLNKAVAPE